MFLQRLCQFVGSCTVSKRLDHADHLCFRLQLRTVEVEIMYHGIQIDFKYRLMHLLRQPAGHWIFSKWKRQEPLISTSSL